MIGFGGGGPKGEGLRATTSLIPELRIERTGDGSRPELRIPVPDERVPWEWTEGFVKLLSSWTGQG